MPIKAEKCENSPDDSPERIYTEVGIDLAGRPQIRSSVKFRIKRLLWLADRQNSSPVNSSLSTFVYTFARARERFSGNRGQTESEAEETREGRVNGVKERKAGKKAERLITGSSPEEVLNL